MTKILNFALTIKGGGREGGTCEVLRPCHPPQNLEHAPGSEHIQMECQQMKLTFPEFHFETEAKVDFPSACI